MGLTSRNLVLGAGMTGLAAGLSSGCTVLEQSERVGGMCASYDLDGYRFEPGGGHWIFGSDAQVHHLIEKHAPVRRYTRRSAVLFTGASRETEALAGYVVPYPIQDNLWALPQDLRTKARDEVLAALPRAGTRPTVAEWLIDAFGPTLNAIFFEPFHARYMAGLQASVAPLDTYKSPVDRARVIHGVSSPQHDTGYNATFVYPVGGLSQFAERLGARCTVSLSSEVERIDTSARAVHLGPRAIHYDRILSTLPLNTLVEACGLTGSLPSPDPHTSLLVVNLGVTLPDTPVARHGYHWLYVPDSQSGLHRVGYYSNVDPSFLPEPYRQSGRHASLYVEVAYPGGQRPTAGGIASKVDGITSELRGLGLVDTVQVADATWIEVAYTWTRPGSSWGNEAIAACRASGIESIGRFGRWTFQGIAASLREGMTAGAFLRAD